MATYTYDPANIAVQGVDKMRFELGDTQVSGGANACALADEEYAAILSQNSNWLAAEIACLRAITARFAMSVDVSADGVSLALSQRYERWKALLAEKEAQCGYISFNRQSCGHYFHLGMHDNPYIGG